MTPEALLDRVVVRPDGCWSWNGGKRPDGRPVLRPVKSSARRSNLLVYRVIFELLEGPIPAGHGLHHTCRTRWCVNVGHLEPVTAADHAVHHPEGRSAGAAAMSRRTHCPKGHPYDEENTRWYKGHRVCKRCDYDRPPRGKGRA